MLRLQLVPRLILNSMRTLGVLALAASWLLIMSSPAGAFDITQITDNSSDDEDPAISGSNVVWYDYDGSDEEIYLWDGETETITQITNNSSDGSHPAIASSHSLELDGARSGERALP